MLRALSRHGSARQFVSGRKTEMGHLRKGETAMSIGDGVFVNTAVLTFGLTSTVFCRGRTARCVTQEPTVPGRARGTNHVKLFSREAT
jgi:hypothetical protein